MSSISPSLPQRYLADLPEEAELSSNLVDEAWRALLRNREQHLANCSTSSILQALQDTAELWLQPDSPFMKLALELGPKQLGFQRTTLEAGLRLVFQTITAENLENWIEQDLGHLRRLDEFCATAAERISHRRSRAVGYESLAHLTAGNIPASAVTSMVSGLLVRSAQFVRCSTGSSLIPRLFAHSIHQVDAQLGTCIEVASWPRNRGDLFTALFDPAECITASGNNDTLASLRRLVPITKRFVGYGHKLSFIFVPRESVDNRSLADMIGSVVQDVCHWNQLGCLSPHVIYVETGAAVKPQEFAASLAAALDTREQTDPRGHIPDPDALTIRSRRSFYEVRAANSQDTLIWQSKDSTAWTVVYEADPLFQASCLNRFVYVKAVASLEELLRAADSVRGQVSTVAMPQSAVRNSRNANRLAEWGVHRICPLGAMQSPPLLWRHDGRPALGELVLWTDLEED